MRRAFVLALLLFLSPAWALDVPRGTASDSRVQRVAYNEDDVVAVYTVAGSATHIVLAPGEEVQDMASGFSAGWEFSSQRNSIYLKPKSVESQGAEVAVPPVPGKWDTNLVVTTNRRVYTFQLFLVAGKPGAEQDPRVAFRVAFSYPGDEAAQEVSRSAEARRQTQLSTPSTVRNLQYTMQVRRGSENIAPRSAYDDGRFTYLRFPSNREIPAVFLVGPDKGESLVNMHVAGDTIVVHRVAPKFMLRLGRSVVAVFNEAFDPEGVPTLSGSTVPGVERVLTRNDRDDTPVLPEMPSAAVEPGFAASAAPTQPALAAAIAPTPAQLQLEAASAPVPVQPIEPEVLPLTVDAPDVQVAEAPALSVSVPPSETWMAMAAEDTLRSAVESWARRSNWRVVWDAKDYYIEADFRLDGDFLSAVETLLRQYRNVPEPLRACAFTKPATPVLLVTRKSECTTR